MMPIFNVGEKELEQFPGPNNPLNVQGIVQPPLPLMQMVLAYVKIISYVQTLIQMHYAIKRLILLVKTIKFEKLNKYNTKTQIFERFN